MQTDENTSTTMFEFHVDEHDLLQAEANIKYEFGGTSSHFINPNDKKLILIGQDECIFQQYIMKGKKWVSPTGERALLPKNDGLYVQRIWFWSVDQ